MCSKNNHFRCVCILTRTNRQGDRQISTDTRVHENKTMDKIQKTYTDEASSESQEEDIRSMDSVTVKSFSINSLRYVILTKLETSSRHARCQIKY